MEKLYLNRFIISYDPITEMDHKESMDIYQFKNLLNTTREEHDHATVQPFSKRILAENVVYSHLTAEFNSIGAFAKATKGDRATIRKYLNNEQPGQLYRKQWKLTFIE